MFEISQLLVNFVHRRSSILRTSNCMLNVKMCTMMWVKSGMMQRLMHTWCILIDLKTAKKIHPLRYLLTIVVGLLRGSLI